MNKKFLSVILFSALMVGTAGTFTSCKDYDDDIEHLDKKTRDLKTQLTTLQSALDAAKSDIAAAKSLSLIHIYPVPFHHFPGLTAEWRSQMHQDIVDGYCQVI